MPSLPREPHSHDFLALAYFERGGGSLRLGNREWRVEAGDLYIIAPGDVVAAGDPSPLELAEGWAVSFPLEVFAPDTPGLFLSWRAHPLLYPFVRGTSEAVYRLKAPRNDRRSWSERLEALDLELRHRQSGYGEAVLAQLTLLLVNVARLAADVVGDLKLKHEPLLAKVFGFIELHYHEPISLRDVAFEASLSAGYLTTLVREKTGRTVHKWITERRMVEARRLLTDTDLAVEEVGRSVGYGDPGYFIRSFRRAHDVTPLAWRRGSRAWSGSSRER